MFNEIKRKEMTKACSMASAGTAEGVGLTDAAKSLYGNEKDSSARERDGSSNNIKPNSITLGGSEPAPN